MTPLPEVEVARSRHPQKTGGLPGTSSAPVGGWSHRTSAAPYDLCLGNCSPKIRAFWGRLVVPVEVTDRDWLGEVEEKVLSLMDPPLNLSRLESNPLRDRLKELRRTWNASGL